MANGQFGGFSDYEQENWEKGNSNSQPKPAAQNNPLASNPYLNSFVQGAGEIKILRPGEEPGTASEQPVLEVNAHRTSMSAGTMKIDRETMSVEFRLKLLREQLDIRVVEDETSGKSPEPSGGTEKTLLKENKLQKNTETVAKTAFTVSQRVGKGIFGFFKEIFGAFKSLYKEMTFKNYTPEQKKKMEEKKKKDAEKAVVKKGFFQKIDENSRNLMMENMKKLGELEDRLAISGMSTEQRNKYLGRRRNMSYAERNVHLAYFIARGMQEEQEAQDKQEQRAKMAQTTGKGMDLNKVAEGGSVLSSTGGQGAG